MTLTRTALTLAILLAAVPALLAAEDPADVGDWWHWRGPTMNGVADVTGLPDSWDPEGGEGSNLLWKRTDLGSRSTPILMNNKLYMICPDHPEEPELRAERVVCLNAVTGDTIWENRWNVFLSDVPRERVGWANLGGDPRTGNVFALGVDGYFQCLDGQTGETLWSHSLSEEFGLLTTYGGRTNTPLVHDSNVIVSGVVIGWGETAKPTDRQLAFDTRNGELVWNMGTRTFPEDTTYSTPVLGTFDGELAMVFASGDGGYHAFQPRTGKKIWSYYVSGRGINYTPLVVGDRVFGGHSEENLDDTRMGALFCVDGTQRGDITETGEVWRVKELFCGRSTALDIDGKLYAIDDRAKMHVLDAATGEELAEQRMGTMMRSSPLYADGKIYTCTVNSRWYIFRPSEVGVEEVHRMRLASGEECHGSPIAAHGRIYFPTTDTMYCIADEEADPSLDLPVDIDKDEIYPFLEEANPADDQVPAQVQVVPAEAMLGPGDQQQFDVRLYNARGQFLKTAAPEEVTLSIEGPGEIAIQAIEGPDGTPGAELWTCSIPEDFAGQAAIKVTATVGESEGTARLRVVPELDWDYDFDDGNVPITWVGCQYRHIVIDYDLFTKLTEADPQAGQLYLYLRTGFVNTGAPAQTFDNSTPAQRWTELLSYLDLFGTADTPTTIEQGEAALGASLQRLQDEGVIASAEWSTWDQPTGEGDATTPAPRLTVTRGERGVEGNGVLVKVKTIPKGARSQGWMGYPNLHDYTIQADVMGAVKDGKLPDIGLIGQRYTMDLMGASQQLQLRTWTPQLDRFSVTVPFAWEPDTWYTMKLQTNVDSENGTAVLRGKVWKRGEEEPAEWTVVGEDALPNVMGSPGLFGNAKDAEIFYDNLSVTHNSDAESGTQPAGG